LKRPGGRTEPKADERMKATMSQTDGNKTRNKWKALFRLFLPCVIFALAAAASIYYLRGQMNMTNRTAATEQRLNDYRFILKNYVENTEELLAGLETDDQACMARQAAFLFTHDTAHGEEDQKLEWIREVLGNDTVQILSAEKAAEALDGSENSSRRISAARLDDGRMISLVFEAGEDESFKSLNASEVSLLMTRLKAGTPGYYMVLYGGEWEIWPRDWRAESLYKLVSDMMENGQLDYAGLKARADQASSGIAIARVSSPATDAFPRDFFSVTGAAYAQDTDFVVNLTETSELRRMGSGRTWCLIFLTAAVFIFLGWSIGRTDLYKPGVPYAAGRRKALLRCRFLLLVACVILVVSVVDIQMLSGVNQNAESTVSAVSSLQDILTLEAERVTVLSKAFNWAFRQRAKTAASFLSDNPDQINMDTLYALDSTLSGTQLEVRDLEDRLIASDTLFRSQSGDQEAGDAHVYRAPLTDAHGQTIGFVDYYADFSSCNTLLEDTTISGVLSSMHTLENLAVLAVEQAQKQEIIASSREEWIGLSPQDLGIDTSLLYNQYEGVLEVAGRERYVSVFTWQGNLIVVACKNSSFLELLRRTAPLLGIILLITLALYWFIVRQQYALQVSGTGLTDEERYPPLRFFAGGFMLALFVLTIFLFVRSENDPNSMTYKLVRGQWIHGVNPVTFTSIMMIYSVFAAVCVLLDLVLERLYQFNSPRGITICQLVKSASRYIAITVLILTTLSMFGVETGTLLGGAGVVALIFTLGANSLLSDVIAGVFLIFDKSFSVGDYVTVGAINAFSGFIQEVSIRSATIRDPESGNIKVISNAALKDVINHSQVVSSVQIDLVISHEIGLLEGERIIAENIQPLPAKYPDIIGTPRYLGVVSMPQTEQGGFKVRVAFDCHEKNRIRLEYQLQRELLWLANLLLNDNSDKGINGCRLPEPT